MSTNDNVFTDDEKTKFKQMHERIEHSFYITNEEVEQMKRIDEAKGRAIDKIMNCNKYDQLPLFLSELNFNDIDKPSVFILEQ